MAAAVCVELDDASAELAVEVADRLHGQGLGTILIEQLAAAAERLGGFQAHATFHDGTDLRGVPELGVGAGCPPPLPGRRLQLEARSDRRRKLGGSCSSAL